jgi:MoaA/NifB/PqqE/SkfB family radical SAM enzyme
VEKTVLEILETTNISNLGVAVSIDGVPQIHEKIRGIKGSWRTSIETYKRLLEIASQFKNFSTHINYTISSNNAGELGGFFESLENEGVKVMPHDISISIAHLGKAFSNENLYGIRLDDAIHLNRALNDLKLLVNTSSAYSLKFNNEIRKCIKRIFLNLAMLRYLRDQKKMVLPCAACFASCFIDPYGNVYPCTVWDRAIGNLRKANYDLCKIWESEEAKHTRIEIKKEQCPNCWSGCESWQSIMQDMPFALKYLNV